MFDHRTPLFFKIWFGIVLSFVLMVFALVSYSIYSVATDPGQIGRLIAEVENGYRDTAK